MVCERQWVILIALVNVIHPRLLAQIQDALQSIIVANLLFCQTFVNEKNRSSYFVGEILSKVQACFRFQERRA